MKEHCRQQDDFVIYFLSSMPMKKEKSLLFVSLALLGGALVLLSGCSWENKPAAQDKPDETLALDKLKKDTPQENKAAATNSQTSQKIESSKTTPMNKKQYPTPPAMTIDPQKEYTAVLETDKGNMTVKLFADKTPKTVNNFVFLAREKFYDDTIFHRTLKGFMIQGGDPEGTGRGGPGYRFEDEPFTGEYKRGTLAMANAGPDTNGSQFFIMHADYALPPNYVIFGEVVEGIEVVDAIATAPTVASEMGEPSKPVTPVVVKSVSVKEE